MEARFEPMTFGSQTDRANHQTHHSLFNIHPSFIEMRCNANEIVKFKYFNRLLIKSKQFFFVLFKFHSKILLTENVSDPKTLQRCRGRLVGPNFFSDEMLITSNCSFCTTIVISIKHTSDQKQVRGQISFYNW